MTAPLHRPRNEFGTARRLSKDRSLLVSNISRDSFERNREL